MNLTELLVLGDLSKEYDCVNRKLVIAKLKKYRRSEGSLSCFKVVHQKKGSG